MVARKAGDGMPDHSLALLSRYVASRDAARCHALGTSEPDEGKGPLMANSGLAAEIRDGLLSWNLTDRNGPVAAIELIDRNDRCARQSINSPERAQKCK